MQRTKIEYLTHTWSPIAMRCTPVSEGCQNCWHLAMAKRLAGNKGLNGLTLNQREAYKGGPPYLIERELEAPLHLKKPARIGVQFMGDLGHESIPDRFIAEVWDVMTRCSEQTFLILTKRPKRFLNWSKSWGLLPFPNLWLGVSVEDQKTADERIPILLQIPAAKRFVSYEPGLGSVDFTRIGGDQFGWGRIDALNGLYYVRANATESGCEWETKPAQKLDWVICGGETGPGARPLHPDRVRSLRDQCQAAGVPFFFKSWGQWKPWAIDDPAIKKTWSDAPDFKKFGYKELRHFLDGKEWREFPK